MSADAYDHPELDLFRLEQVDAPEIKNGRKRRGDSDKSTTPGRKLDPTLFEAIKALVAKHPGKLTRGRGAAMLGEERRKFNRHFEQLVRDGECALSAAGKMEKNL